MKTLVDMKKFVESCNKIYSAEQALSKAADEFNSSIKPVVIAADLRVLKEMHALVSESSYLKTYLGGMVNQLQIINLLEGLASGEEDTILQAVDEIASSASYSFASEQSTQPTDNNVLAFPGSNAVH
jgi:hypothetical protein